jgi:hypothetical protein
LIPGRRFTTEHTEKKIHHRAHGEHREEDREREERNEEGKRTR